MRPRKSARGPPLLPAAVAAAAFPLAALAGYVPPAKYLLVSNAQNGTIGYIQIPRDGVAQQSTARVLIDKQLVHPQGIAVDQKRQLLLIADSGLRKVVSYGLMVHEDGSLGVDDQTPVAEDVESRWVAVDGPGNVYMTDEEKGQVLKITSRQVLDGDTRAQPVFAAQPAGPLAGQAPIRAPGGVATDNFHVYWTNKDGGQEIGTVVRALESAPPPPPRQTDQAAAAGAYGAPADVAPYHDAAGLPIAPAAPAPALAPQPMTDALALARNLPKAYGLCLAGPDRVFYTGHERGVFAVPMKGGGPADAVSVATDLRSPRGCAWDGEATVFVADRSAGAVFAVPGSARPSAGGALSTKVATFEGAFGVAVFSGATGGSPTAWRTVLLGAASLAVAVMAAPARG